MGSPLRILHVVVNMNRGGAETLIMNLYRNIDRDRVQFDFLTCREGVFDEEIRGLGGRVYRTPYVSDVGHFGFIKALDRFFGSHKEYRIIHSHLDKMSGFVLHSAKRAGISVRIAHSHNTQSEGGLAAKVYKSMAGKLILPSATHLLSCSKAAAQWLFANKADTSVILKNGIESDRFAYSTDIRQRVRDELKISEETFVIGHVGRFHHQKNHLFLIDIFAELIKQQDNTILALAGDGPLRPVVEEKVRDLNLQSKVLFLGIREDIYRLLQAFDVFAFPSFHEGLPVTLIEAQGAGLPCVVSQAVTNEVDMGIGLVEHCHLGDINSWVGKIIKSAQKARGISPQALYEKGYDIKNTAKWAQNFYLATLG